MQSWTGLLANFAVVAIFIALWVHLQDRVDRLDRYRRSIVLGLVMGTGAVGAMMLPFSVGPGQIVDLRSVPLGLAGLFGGPLAAVFAAVMAIAMRLSLGGAGAVPGSLQIVLAAVVGVGGYAVLAHHRMSRRDLVLFGAVLGVAGLAGFLATPPEVRLAPFLHIGLPSAIINFVATTMGAIAILIEMRRRELAATNRVLAAAFKELPDCINVKDTAGRFLVANPATARLMHAPSAEALIGKSDFDFYPAATAERFRDIEEQVLATGESREAEQLVAYDDAASVWVHTLKAPLHGEHNELVGLITHNRDVSERKRLELDLENMRERLDYALANMADALVMFDAEGRLEFCNEQYLRMFPKTADVRVPGSSFRFILTVGVTRGEESPDDSDVQAWLDKQVAALGEEGDKTIRLADGRWLQGRTRRVRDGAVLISISDITRAKLAEAELAGANARLEELAATDGLTGLLNRRSFDSHLEREYARCRRENVPISLLMVDVDHFKSFNDAYGHQAGDECLRTIAECMRQTMQRPADILARYGGEEFAVILSNTSREGAAHLARELRQAVRRQAIAHEKSEKRVVTVSIGVATASWTPPVAQPDALIRHADEALYLAKSSGRDMVRVYRAAHADSHSAA